MRPAFQAALAIRKPATNLRPQLTGRHRIATAAPRRTSSAQMQTPPPSEGVKRYSFPFLVDAVVVSSASTIRELEEHPAVVRIEQSVPPILRFLLSGTWFYAAQLEQYPVAFAPTGDADVARRRKRITDFLETTFDEAATARMKALLTGDATRQDVAKALIEIMFPRIMGFDDDQPIPEDILEALEQMANLNSVPNYFRARAARKKVEEYAKKYYTDDKLRADALHDLGTAYSGGTAGFLNLQAFIKEGGTDDKDEYLAQHPVLPFVPRVVTVDTKLEGILDLKSPLKKNSSLIVYNIGAAAKETNNLDFVFGTGDKARECPFRKAFMNVSDRIVDKSEVGGKPQSGSV